MLSISYTQVFITVTVIWILLRMAVILKNKGIHLKRECELLTVYICIVVIARIVYFPWHLEDGHIGLLHFNAERIFPFWLKLTPVVHLFDIYDGWKLNLLGNITMFIPVGIFWPFCFKKLNNVGKVVFAGFGYSLIIEISQLLFYERSSDIDDLITNTTGVLIGALIYFGIQSIIKKVKLKSET